MAREGIPSAVLLDALGTLIELETPWPHLVEELGARGVVVGEDAAREAMRAEMAYYRAHHDEAGSWAGLKDLRRRCAAVVQERARHRAAARGRRRTRSWRPSASARTPMRPPRCAPAGRRHAPGRRLQLGHLAARRPRGTELRALVDTVVISAELGVAKPDPAIFRAALDRRRHRGRRDARRRQRRARRRGRARRGPRALLVARNGAEAPEGVRVVASLDGLLMD